MLSNVIQVYVGEDPYLSHVVTQLVTKSGQYYNMSAARLDIGAGRVFVNGTEARMPQAIFMPGLYNVTVGINTYKVQLNHSAKE